MKISLAFAFLLLPSLAQADATIDACLAAWKNAPFKKGAEPDQVVGTQVKVLGIGKDDFTDPPSKKPRLVLIKPSVNVLGKTEFRLMNPNGWYCFRTNVSVLGKMSIEAHCKAHLASNGDGGTSVLGSNESDGGTAVLGSLRINRVGDCDAKAGKEEKVESEEISADAKADSKEEKKDKKASEPKVVTVTATATMTSTGTASH